ncbi:leucine-rich repeat-containing protein 14 isoform X1 [Micropterus dolomieu]|uniref:leucine-rich repeat-containing protein 14 isoform X1 n=2 Tax=Micropterus dolomieu TaxID=147949 RepID=UPI001E8E6B6C|nr:leucine-rich repeat-containing protein 14 isoform X1 [Micropterus dolomieu]XP_045895629.1 leucine-rich repeat-containing protein 14 isoform X1 [Micropterus dolomieu]
MVLSLVSLCAREVVSDHSSSPCWLRWLPGELYRPLLEAAFTSCRPLAVCELVQRWPERTLRVGGRKKQGQTAPNRLCIQALLLAVVRGLSDLRCALQVLDLCGLQGDEGGMGDHMGGWSLTVALCTMVVQARAGASRAQRREREQERKRFSALEREKGVKRERGEEPNGDEARTDKKELGVNKRERMGSYGILGEEEVIKGVRRRMEMERKRETAVAGLGGSRKEPEEKDVNSDVLVHVRADLFVNARSWERVRVALSTPGPLKLQCRHLRVEEISVSNIKTMLGLLPRQVLLGVDVRYSSLGVAGLAELLPLLSTFPALNSLRLHYCNLDFRRDQPGQEEALRDLSVGLAKLQELRRLSLTALRLPGQLRVLLSSLPQPLEILELPYLSLTPTDLAYLSCSHHASKLQQLDLSENHLDENTLPSIRRLLSQASGSLQHLSLSGCGLTDGLLGLLLPSVGGCWALKSLALALNPLSMAGLMDLVRMAVRMQSLRHLLYPNPLEDYQPGLPDLPSSAQLLDWPLDEATDINTTSSHLNRVLIDSGRCDLFLTCDLLNYDKDLVD